jgi:hypothetical protein
MINNVDLGSANYGPPAAHGSWLQFIRPADDASTSLINIPLFYNVIANQKTDFKFTMFLTFFNSVGFWKSYEYFART